MCTCYYKSALVLFISELTRFSDTTSMNEWLHQIHFKQVNNLPKSMNCFIESGVGEYFENLSTCLGMFSFELFFSMICANFMLIFK